MIYSKVRTLIQWAWVVPGFPTKMKVSSGCPLICQRLNYFCCNALQNSQHDFTCTDSVVIEPESVEVAVGLVLQLKLNAFHTHQELVGIDFYKEPKDRSLVAFTLQAGFFVARFATKRGALPR
jgi:hypothetical protein